jgi:endonuclease-3
VQAAPPVRTASLAKSTPLVKSSVSVKTTVPKKTSGKVPANFPIVLKLLKKYYPDAHCALHHSNPFELLVATILSAQCTDERVNLVTPHLFEMYPTPEKLGDAPLDEIELAIRSINFFRNKAKNLKTTGLKLVANHGGQVPQTVEELTELAGVGRKTANVVLGDGFGITNGIVVDTHVARLSFRLGWVKGDNPVVIEQALCKFVPREEWVMLPHYLIFHGRQICKARRPLCERCFLFEHCPKKGVKQTENLL